MSLDSGTIQHIANLARLSLDDHETSAAQTQLNRVLEMINELQAADTQGIEPMAHPLDTAQYLRPDEVTEGNIRDEVQKIAPATENGLYLVPRVIE